MPLAIRFHRLWNTACTRAFTAAVVLWMSVCATALAQNPAVPAPSIKLTDHNGTLVTEHTFKGKPSVVFFGFTHCPDICPTTLSEMSLLLDELGAGADRINFIFMSVDPERDTPKALKAYLDHFDPRIFGLTGPIESITRFAKGLGATFKKVPIGGGEYVMDHPIMHYVLDESWQRTGVLYARSNTAGRARTLNKLRTLIRD